VHSYFFCTSADYAFDVSTKYRTVRTYSGPVCTENRAKTGHSICQKSCHVDGVSDSGVTTVAEVKAPTVFVQLCFGHM
jgi:hypothetical protein